MRESAREYPVVTVFGPRQSGKTTLVQMTFPKKPYRSLEEPDLRRWADMDPKGFLADLPHGAVLDEIQRCPDLLSYIQGHVDRGARPGTFILTGSHQPELHQAVSQTLAGRTAVLTLLPFSLKELRHYRKRWRPFELVIMGGFPRLHEGKLTPRRFYNGYLQTYVERDVRALINVRDLRLFQQFMILLAGRVGQVVNYSSLGNDLGLSSTTIKQWISVMKACYVVLELPPFFENIHKRVVKSPKLYFTDTGLAAHLLGLGTAEQAERDPLRGGLFENLIITEVAKAFWNQGVQPDLYFYRDSHGNEVDLLIRRGRDLIPVEIKSGATFSEEFLRGIRRFYAARETGEKQGGFVVYAGERRMNVGNVTAFNPFLHDDLERLAGISTLNTKVKSKN